jgi:hypothetical protein
MAYRSVVLTPEQYAQERMYDEPLLAVPDVAAGDEVLIVAATEPPVVFGVGRFEKTGFIKYTERNFDEAVPADAGLLAGGVIEAGVFSAFARRLQQPRTKGRDRVWMVSLDLPIEAPTPGEAVRRFWSYVRELGPVELPTYVAPAGDELAMQAFVLGAEASQDPEED